MGHSSRSLEALVALLRAAGVSRLLDVRRSPGSRRHPQWNRGSLERALAERGIDYVWLGRSLGGRVGEILPPERSPNGAWQEPAFRHYADAMETPAFQEGFSVLESLAREAPSAVLCAERDWRRCHRQLLADLLVVRGWRVEHLVDGDRREAHRLTEWARVEQGRLSYPALL